MKKLTIQFEFADTYDHDEIAHTIFGCVSEMDYELAEELSYTIVERA